ncbi:MAG: chromosomal replication initiator protein DnaA [Paludibacteraceae bacterium]|nr:chromosomal replication initiator protein DnaA [Paludibacteraceae bacterium]
MHDQLSIKWQECQRILADNLTASAYQTWFKPLQPLQYEGGVLVLQVKSQFVAEYIEENYINILSRAILRVFGSGTQLEYRVLIDSASGAGSNIPSPGAQKENLLKEQGRSSYQPQPNRQENFETQLNSLYTFESFVPGEPNKLARTAGVAIAKQPGFTAFNPLFIYGGSGVGKTHLANAIGNQVALLFPHARVLYVTANTFKLQFQDAHNLNRIPDFLNFYQSVDVLIVDDIQYFAGLKGTQDTFFHIFNYLQQSRKQLILTSDRSPLELRDIEDRLLTRFKWGLSAEIRRPDYQLRKDILHNKMHHDGIHLSDEVVDFIATHVTDSVRDLEGVLASLLAHATLTDREIDLELTEQVVGRIVRIQTNSTQLEQVLQAVSEHFNVGESTLLGKVRSKHVMTARHVAIFLGKELTTSSLTEIGAFMGQRNHATVLHSINAVRDMLTYDPVLRQHIQQIRDALQRK